MTNSDSFRVRAYRHGDETEVIALWHACELTRPWNPPHDEIALKLASDPQGLIIAERCAPSGACQVVGTVMAGYDGHRGWINYLAVDPNARQQGIGRMLMAAAEDYLKTQGAPKINLQVRLGNEAVLAFYARLGYLDDQVVGLGKRIGKADPDTTA